MPGVYPLQIANTPDIHLGRSLKFKMGEKLQTYMHFARDLCARSGISAFFTLF